MMGKNHMSILEIFDYLPTHFSKEPEFLNK